MRAKRAHNTEPKKGKAELPWLKGRDLELVMGEALCHWIGWPLPAGAGG